MTNNKYYQWAVIGAGPAGIAAVGKLLDNQIVPSEIVWIDPAFKVGDLGRCWQKVSSNTKVLYFKNFLNEAASFQAEKFAKNTALYHLPEENTCELSYVVEPLQAISDQLCEKVHHFKALIEKLSRVKGYWHLQDNQGQGFYVQNVILANGAEPKRLAFENIPEISLKLALDKAKLAETIHADETIAVVGSSHSAIIVVRNLIELNCHKVINFYRSPCRYALEMGDWILHDNTGLKGETAVWAKENIDGNLPKNLQRICVSINDFSESLKSCDKVIYAVGFQRRDSIQIEHMGKIDYNPFTGIIAPGLYGCGIAYPQLKTDPLGNQEEQVGLWKFMKYLNEIIPVWLRYNAS